MIVSMFVKNWHESHTFLSDSIRIVLVAGVIISWTITLIKHIKARKHNNGAMLRWILLVKLFNHLINNCNLHNNILIYHIDVSLCKR